MISKYKARIGKKWLKRPDKYATMIKVMTCGVNMRYKLGKSAGGVKSGSFKNGFNSCIYSYMYRIDSNHPSSGRKVCRFGGNPRSSGYILG